MYLHLGSFWQPVSFTHSVVPVSFEEDPDTAEAADLEDHDLQQVLLSYEESDEDEWEVDRGAAEDAAESRRGGA